MWHDAQMDHASGPQPPTSASDAPAPADQPLGGLAILNRDLFFGVRIGNTLRSLGYDPRFARNTTAFAVLLRGEPPPVLGVIDLSAGPDWDVIKTLTSDPTLKIPILLFGAHKDVNGLRAAKAAGVTRVVSNGDFHRDMVELVRRYARPVEDLP